MSAIIDLTAKGLSLYPEYDELIPVIASKLGVSDDSIKLTNGADDAIKCIVDCYLDKGDKILIPVPTFDMFRFYSEVAGARIKTVLYNDDLSFPAGRIIESIDEDTKIVVIVNPNNPTGSAADPEEVEKIVKAAKGSIVLIDEAYIEFYGKSALPLLDKYENVMIVRTFSKAYGLAGLRLGYIVADKKKIADVAKSSSPYNVNSVAAAAGKAALLDEGFVDRYVSEIRTNREYVKKSLEDMGLYVYPSETNFLVVYLGDECGRVCDELKEKGILIRNRTKDPLLKDCARITIGTREQCDRMLDAMRSVSSDTLLFDMDGVLADVSSSYREAIRLTAEYFLGEKVEVKEIQELKMEGGFNNDWALTQELTRRRGKDILFSQVKEKFQEFYKGSDYDGLIDDEALILSREILDNLSRRFNMGIVTGRPKDEALFFLKRNGIDDIFSTVVALEDVGEKGKPDPYGLELAMKKLKGSKAIYLGDSVDDILAAKDAGMQAIGVIPPGLDDPKQLRSLLKEKGASVVYDAGQLGVLI